MEDMKRCKQCGDSFTAMRWTQLYCCHRCKNLTNQMRSRRVKEIKECADCGTSFASNTNYQKYCSRRCQNRVNAMGRRNKHLDHFREVEARFTRKRSAIAKIGSVLLEKISQLNEAHSYSIPVPTSRQCLHCGEIYISKLKAKKYCSTRCQKRASNLRIDHYRNHHQQKKKNKQLSLDIKHCALCGAIIQGRQRKYCAPCALDAKRKYMKEYYPKYQPTANYKRGRKLKRAHKSTLVTIGRAALEVIPTLKELLPHD